MKAKEQLKAIINYLAGNDFYYCYEYEGLYQADECYCAEDILQRAFDSIYTSVCGILGSYRITTDQLTEEAIEALTVEAYEQAERYHLRFNNLRKQEIIEHINNNKELKQLLLDTYTETAHNKQKLNY